MGWGYRKKIKNEEKDFELSWEGNSLYVSCAFRIVIVLF
jgi:hypothetical protein